MNKCILEGCDSPARQKFCCTRHRHTYYRRVKGVPSKKKRIEETRMMVDKVIQAHKDGDWLLDEHAIPETVEHHNVSLFSVQKARFELGFRGSSPSGKNSRKKAQEKVKMRGIMYRWGVIPERVGLTRNQWNKHVKAGLDSRT